MRRALGPLLVVLALASGMAGAGEAKTILIVAGTEKQIFLPAILAERLGYFRDEGLDVELQSEPSGVRAADVLLAGSAHGVIGSYDHTIDLQAKGKSVQSVVQLAIAPGEVELVASRAADRIRSPADFKGVALGVTGLGSSTSFLTQYLALTHGLRLADLNLVPVGAGAPFTQAMRQGRIDAGMTTEPTASLLLASGDAKVLVDLRTPEGTHKALGGLYPFSCLYMETRWIRKHPEQVQKLVNAFVRTLRFMAGHSAAEIAAQLPPEMLGGNPAIYVQSLAGSKAMFTADGLMPEAGPATVLRALQTVNFAVRNKPVDLRETYTTDFVRAAH
ncbi:ABC transporter substrate-binding protein [Ramlibacter sp. G-1-2-2]|uniref:ABC transporter substrate-binding protein n=1 Tax=Ramlibacter agri TaxID=2728837 RepID=A0A848H0P3_9BURK|nr:ABC transporter substrate-binding protein [Ramlibacter agri]NML43191.1 ABC transporter substrate-binding protein [Ramlibacter agri]